MLSKISFGVALVVSVAAQDTKQEDEQIRPCSGERCDQIFADDPDYKQWDWKKFIERPEAEQMKREYEEFIQVPDFTGPRRAYCKMQRNPVYPTSNPFGWFQFWQWNSASPVYIWGNMYNLPPPSSSQHAIAINQSSWDHKDCASSGPHLQSVGQVHGAMNEYSPNNSHNGALTPLNSFGSSANYWAVAQKPDMFSFSYGVNPIYKAMTVYEFGDDEGDAGTYASKIYGSACREIACCNIRKLAVNWAAQSDIKSDTSSGRNLGAIEEEEVDYFTPEEHRELFGFDPEPTLGDLFDQN